MTVLFTSLLTLGSILFEKYANVKSIKIRNSYRAAGRADTIQVFVFDSLKSTLEHKTRYLNTENFFKKLMGIVFPLSILSNLRD